jgi:excisionase family DNA binding protein
MSTVAKAPQSHFLSVGEVAYELNVTERFVRKLIAQEDLNAVRVGNRLIRICRTDLEAVLHPMFPRGSQHAHVRTREGDAEQRHRRRHGPDEPTSSCRWRS